MPRLYSLEEIDSVENPKHKLVLRKHYIPPPTQAIKFYEILLGNQEDFFMAHYSMAEKADLLRRWKKSGVSRLRFARQEGIGYATFLRWVSGARDILAQHPEENEQETLPVVHVASVRFSRETETSGISLQIGDVRVGLEEDFSATALARVVEVLRRC